MRWLPLLLVLVLVPSAQAAELPMAANTFAGDVTSNEAGNDFSGFSDIKLGMSARQMEDMGFHCDQASAIPSCDVMTFGQRPEETHATTASSVFGARVIAILVAFNSAAKVTTIIKSIRQDQCTTVLQRIAAIFGPGLEKPNGVISWSRQNSTLGILPGSAGEQYCTVIVSEI